MFEWMILIFFFNDTDFEVSNVMIDIIYREINMMIKQESESVVEELSGHETQGVWSVQKGIGTLGGKKFWRGKMVDSI